MTNDPALRERMTKQIRISKLECQKGRHEVCDEKPRSGDNLSAKAAEDGRTPRRCRVISGASIFRQVLECGCPLPLLLESCPRLSVRISSFGFRISLR